MVTTGNGNAADELDVAIPIKATTSIKVAVPEADGNLWRPLSYSLGVAERASCDHGVGSARSLLP